MKHTKGPWKIEVFDPAYKKSKPIHIYGGIFEIAQAIGEDIETRSANAHLIAAGPDLLEEHKRWAKILGHIIVSHLQGSHETLDVYQYMKIEYRDGEPCLKSETIAKAEGRE